MFSPKRTRIRGDGMAVASMQQYIRRAFDAGDAMATAALQYRTVTPSTRTLQMTAAAEKLRACIDHLKDDYSLTAGEVSLMLAGETMRHATHELAFERQIGRTDPLAHRHIQPNDARANEALAVADGIANAALDG